MKNKNKKNSFFGKVKKIFKLVLGVIFFCFAIAITLLLLNYNKYNVTQFGNTSLVIINDDLANENYKKGDLVIVESKKITNINKGDEVFAYQVDREGNATISLGKVGKVHEKENAISYENGSTYDLDFVIGTETKKYEKIGTYLSIIESKWGFLFIVLVPCFLLFLYEIYSLIIEIRYGNEDESEA